MKYIVIFDDKRCDKIVEAFDHINEAILKCEKWIESKGYEVCDFESMDWRDQDVKNTALMGWYSETSRDVEIFIIN